MPYLASLIAALAFCVLVGLMAVPLLKLGKVFDRLGEEIVKTSEQAQKAIGEGTVSLKEVNAQLEKVDAVTTSVAQVAQDVSAVSTLVSATIGGPLVKVAAFSQATRKVFSQARKGTQVKQRGEEK